MEKSFQLAKVLFYLYTHHIIRKAGLILEESGVGEEEY